jgi:hypothetical protein
MSSATLKALLRNSLTKLAFPFEQFEPSLAFSSMADVIKGKSPVFRNVITPDLSEGVRGQSLGIWTQKAADGLGTRAELVQKSYDLKPATLVKPKRLHIAFLVSQEGGWINGVRKTSSHSRATLWARKTRFRIPRGIESSHVLNAGISKRGPTHCI